MIAEAVDTARALAWVLAAWIAVLTVAGMVVVLAGLAVGTWAVRGLWGAVGAVLGPRTDSLVPLAAERPAEDPSPPGAGERRSRPSWARTDKDAA